MMTAIKYLFSSQYLIDTGVKGLSSSDKLYWILALIFLAFGIFAFIYKHGKNPVTRALAARWDHLGFTIGIAGLFWTLLRYELVNTLSAHLFIWLIYLVALIWKFFILRYRFGKYRVEIAEYEREQQKKKYM